MRAPEPKKPHDRKLRQRNYAVLAALLAWCIIIFAVAIVKMSGGGQ
jgi:hypothetical protein